MNALIVTDHAAVRMAQRGIKTNNSDLIASFLLSARCKRPRSGASNQANELAPPHLTHRERIVPNFWTIAASIERANSTRLVWSNVNASAASMAFCTTPVRFAFMPKTVIPTAGGSWCLSIL